MDEFFVERVDAWLQAKGVTLWADWNVTDPVQRRKAAVWFVGQWAEQMEWARKDRQQRFSQEYDVA